MSWESGKIKLVTAISILLVTGFLFTSLASYFVSRASLRSEISLNELPITSDNIYSEIQHDLLRPIFISSFMATDTFLRDWVLDGEKGEQQISSYLREIQKKYNTISSFFVSEKTRTYYHADGILKKVSPTEERDRWYFRVSKMTDEYEINIDHDLANKDEMTIFINYRVLDYDQNYIGATGVGLTVSAVKKLIEIYQHKYNRTIYFAGKNGDITLAGPGFDETVTNVAQLGFYSLFTEKTGQASGRSFTYKKDNQVIHTNIRYLKDFDWYLIVEQPEKEAVKNIFSTLIFNVFICILITIIVLLLLNASITAYQKKIETLRGIVPICSFCKQIRDDKGYWNQVEAFVEKHTDAQFSHSICPSCLKEHYPEEYRSAKPESQE